MTRRLTLALMVAMLCGCGTQVAETRTAFKFDEDEMQAAISRARREVDGFIKELTLPTGSEHAIRVQIEDQGQTEHVWLIDVSFKDGEFQGTVKQEPETIRNVRMGQKLVFRKLEISDWMYMRANKMYGNYTVRPMLDGMSEEEAYKYRAMFAEP